MASGSVGASLGGERGIVGASTGITAVISDSH